MYWDSRKPTVASMETSSKALRLLVMGLLVSYDQQQYPPFTFVPKPDIKILPMLGISPMIE